MTIRNALVRDVPALASVYLASVLAAYKGIATPEHQSERDLSKCIEQWTYNIHDDAVSVVVAEREATIMGLASFGRARDQDVDTKLTGELQAIYVSPDRWGQGVGRELCSHVLQRLDSAGFHSVLLWVLADNGGATRFYTKLGFEPDGTSKPVTMGRELTAVRYRLDRQTAT